MYLCNDLSFKRIMAKKKTKKGTQQTFLSPEKYIREKARTLKIKACYITDDYDTSGLGIIVVAREHTGGNVTFGTYLVDKFCLGVKDTTYRFRMDAYDFEDYLDSMNGMTEISEISYEEAHNIIYGAVEFAREAGIEPHKNFSLTQYILEEDTEDVPLIEYEYGKDGKHYLFVDSQLEASKYLPTLRKNLGYNFEWDVDDSEDYDDDYANEGYDGFLDRMKNSPMFKTYGPDTEYTYKRPEYPSSKEIENPIVEEILCDPKNAIALSHEQVDTLLALPHESLRHDLEQLIMYHLGLGCDGVPEKTDGEEFVGVICNAVMLLAEVGNADSSLDVVFEVLRQSEDFYDYHICDCGTEAFVPTIYKLGQNRLDKLMSFMREEGLYDFAKIHVPAAVALIVRHSPERRSEVIEWFRELTVFAAEKLPETQAIDSVIAGFIVNNLMDIKAKELLPEIEAMFSTGLVDEGNCGRHKDVVREISDSDRSYITEHITDIYERYDDVRKKFGKS